MEIAHRIEHAPNEAVCGDALLIVEDGSSVLIVVADGEGHGPAASEASHRLCEYVANNSEQRLDDLLWGAHRALKGERGVAVIVLRVDRVAHSLSFCGVGNVELQTLSKVPIRPVCDLTAISTLRNLRAGLRECLKRKRADRVRSQRQVRAENGGEGLGELPDE